jgi:hypothetical protein
LLLFYPYAIENILGFMIPNQAILGGPSHGVGLKKGLEINHRNVHSSPGKMMHEKDEH